MIPPNTDRLAAAADIRTARHRLGISQNDTARLLGVNTRTYQRWEAGEQDIPAIVWPAMRCLEYEAGVRALPAAA